MLFLPPNQQRQSTEGSDESKTILPAQRYASAGTSCGFVSVCLSVCLSVTGRSSIETAERIEPVTGTRASVGSSYIVLKGHAGVIYSDFYINDFYFMYLLVQIFTTKHITSYVGSQS